MLVGLALFPALALINQVYSRRVEVPAARTQARLGEVATVAHESFEGALVVKSLGLEDREVGRLRPGRRRPAHRPAGGRPPAGHVRARARRPARTSGSSRCWPSGSWRISTGAHRRPASWSRRWRCSASSPSRCASSGSCSRRCPAPWWRPTGIDDGAGHAEPPAARARRRPRPLPGGPADGRGRGPRLRLRRRPRSSTASTWRLAAGRGRGPRRGHRRRASRRCATCSPTCTSPRSGAVRLGGVDLAPRRSPTRSGRTWRWRSRRRSCSPTPVRENLTLGRAGRRRRRALGARPGPGRPVRRPAARTGSTRSSASGA